VTLTTPPELIDHLKPVVLICYHVAYIFELQTGQRWSMPPAFALIPKSIFFNFLEGQSIRRLSWNIFRRLFTTDLFGPNPFALPILENVPELTRITQDQIGDGLLIVTV
jgi:hypothetical protein